MRMIVSLFEWGWMERDISRRVRAGSGTSTLLISLSLSRHRFARYSLNIDKDQDTARKRQQSTDSLVHPTPVRYNHNRGLSALGIETASPYFASGRGPVLLPPLLLPAPGPRKTPHQIERIYDRPRILLPLPSSSAVCHRSRSTTPTSLTFVSLARAAKPLSSSESKRYKTCSKPISDSSSTTPTLPKLIGPPTSFQAALPL